MILKLAHIALDLAPVHPPIRMIQLRASNAYVKPALVVLSAKMLFQMNATLIVDVVHVENVMMESVSVQKAGMESNAKNAPKIKSAIQKTMAELVISKQVNVIAILDLREMHNVLQKAGKHAIESVVGPMDSVLKGNASA